MKNIFFLFCIASCLMAAQPQNEESCSRVGYRVYGELLFLQPNGSNLYWAVQAHPFDESVPTPIVSPNWFEYEISPAYHPAFDVGMGLLFRDMKMSLTLNWERLRGRDVEYQDVTPGATQPMIGPIFDIGPNSAHYQSGKGKAKFCFDASNLMLGKEVSFGERLKTNMYAGAAFARICQTISSRYMSFGENVSRTITNPSTFSGGGSRFGFDFDFRIFRHLSFTGSSFFSLLMGKMTNHTVYKSWTPDLALLSDPQPNVQKTQVADRSQLVPGFEERLGFAYTFPTCGRWTRQVLLKIGYQFQIYLNAVQSFDMVSQVLPNLLVNTPDAGLYAVAYQRTLSNFALTGPYANLDFEF